MQILGFIARGDLLLDCRRISGNAQSARNWQCDLVALNRRDRALPESHKSPARVPTISILKFDANILPPTERGGYKRTTAARKGVENERAWLREGLNERHQNADGFLRRMRSVPGVLPRLNVLDRVIRRRRETLGQKIRLLMMSPQESTARRVALVPDDVPHSAETGLGPRLEKGGSAAPSVERHAEGVGLEHSMDIVERAESALGVAVIGDRAPEAIAIVHEVGRVSDHEIDAVARKCLQDLGAIPVDDLVRDERGNPFVVARDLAGIEFSGSGAHFGDLRANRRRDCLRAAGRTPQPSGQIRGREDAPAPQVDLTARSAC